MALIHFLNFYSFSQFYQIPRSWIFKDFLVALFVDFKDFFQYPNSRIFKNFFNDLIPRLLVDFLLIFFRASTVGFLRFFSETSFEGFKTFFNDFIRGFIIRIFQESHYYISFKSQVFQNVPFALLNSNISIFFTTYVLKHIFYLILSNSVLFSM